MRKLMAVLALAVAVVPFAPRPALAQQASCTNDYTQCMNDSWMTSGWLQVMADVECFNGYITCIRKNILSV